MVGVNGPVAGAGDSSFSGRLGHLLPRDPAGGGDFTFHLDGFVDQSQRFGLRGHSGQRVWMMKVGEVRKDERPRDDAGHIIWGQPDVTIPVTVRLPNGRPAEGASIRCLGSGATSGADGKANCVAQPYANSWPIKVTASKGAATGLSTVARAGDKAVVTLVDDKPLKGRIDGALGWAVDVVEVYVLRRR